MTNSTRYQIKLHRNQTQFNLWRLSDEETQSQEIQDLLRTITDEV